MTAINLIDSDACLERCWDAVYRSGREVKLEILIHRDVKWPMRVIIGLLEGLYLIGIL